MKNVKSNNIEKSFDTTALIRASDPRARRERSRTAKTKSTGIAVADKPSELPIRGVSVFTRVGFVH